MVADSVRREPGRKQAIAYTEAVLLRAAKRICSETLGASIRLSPPEAVRGWDERTWTRRCHIVDPGPADPSTIILKQFRLGAGHGMAEWAGLEFIDRLGIDPPFAPRLYGGDIDLSLIVIEDLGDAGTLGLSRILAGDDSDRAGDALVAASGALGRLHAAACGRNEEYHELRRRLPAAGHAPFHQAFRTREALESFVGNLTLPGVRPAAGVQEELEAIAGRLADPGPFLTFTHGDTCASNIILVDGSARFFDLEVSGYRHALLDGAFVTLRLLGCQESGLIPAHVQRRMEAAYRRELTAGVPEAAEDERFTTELVAMTAVWLALLLDRLERSLEQDRKMVTGTNRQRILYALEEFSRLAEERACYPALRQTADDLYLHLCERWPGPEHQLDPFPAFT